MINPSIRAFTGITIAAAVTVLPLPASADAYKLVIEEHKVNITGRERPATLINGQLPGPVLRFKEGEEVTIQVTNRLDEISSIHWHGLLLPSSQDGVPGISGGFQGIPPGETFPYRFLIKQAGTYWYHSHSAGQEQTGMYAPIIIEPKKREPFRYDREYIVMLSDWTDEHPEEIIRNLKMNPSYYNYNQRTIFDFFRDVQEDGLGVTLRDRLSWAKMRMDPTDIADVTGATYTYLVNGQTPQENFTVLFKPSERIRLRFINSSAMTYFDVRIPSLKMAVVQADGNNVLPVPVDEFRIAVAETYDVIVRPTEDKAYAILAESMDRTGFARATLAPREGMIGEIPPHRPRPILTLADMGMSFGPTGFDRGTIRPETDRPGHVAPMDMDHGDRHEKAPPTMPDMDHSGMNGDQMQGMDHSNMPRMNHDAAGSGMKQQPGQDSMDYSAIRHGMPDPVANDTGAPPSAKVLSYYDLKAHGRRSYDNRPPDRIIEIRLTGNMERYFWSINGRKFSEAQPIVLNYGERVRFRFINETMMNHAMHLHGMWMLPQVGNGARNPLKHVVNIKPGAILDVDIPVNAEGSWAFHCHLLYHLETGMMREVIVQRPSVPAQ